VFLLGRGDLAQLVVVHAAGGERQRDRKQRERRQAVHLREQDEDDAPREDPRREGEQDDRRGAQLARQLDRREQESEHERERERQRQGEHDARRAVERILAQADRRRAAQHPPAIDGEHPVDDADAQHDQAFEPLPGDEEQIRGKQRVDHAAEQSRQPRAHPGGETVVGLEAGAGEAPLEPAREQHAAAIPGRKRPGGYREMEDELEAELVVARGSLQQLIALGHEHQENQPGDDEEHRIDAEPARRRKHHAGAEHAAEESLVLLFHASSAAIFYQRRRRGTRTKVLAGSRMRPPAP